MLQLIVSVAGAFAAYLWWGDNRLLAWLALACVAGIFLTTSGLRTHEVRRRASVLRNVDVLLSNVWGTVGWVCVLGSIGLLVAVFL